ncbi:hypothetical protein HDU98_010801, partial [Podochytrium sp. JEL0797]
MSDLALPQAQVSLLHGEKRALETKVTDLSRRANMLEFALKHDRKRYHAERAETLRSEHSLHSADTSPSPAPPFPDSEVPLSIADQSAKQLGQIPSSVVPIDTPAPAPALATSSHNLSKALNHTRSREILKTYLLEANHLLACATLPPVSSSPPRVVPDVSVDSRGEVANVLEDAEEEEDGEEEEELRFRTRGPAISESISADNTVRENAARDEQSQKHVTILKKKASSSAVAESSLLNGGKRRHEHSQREYVGDAAVPSSNGSSTVATDDEDGYELGPNTRTTNDTETTDDTAKFWKPIATLTSHLDAIRCVTFLPPSSPHQKMLATCSEDGTAKLWTLNTGSGETKKKNAEPVVMTTFRGHVGNVTSLCARKDGRVVYTGGSDSSVRVWEVKEGGAEKEMYSSFGENPQLDIIPAHTDTVWDMQLNDSASGSNGGGEAQKICLATASADGSVKIFDVEGGHRLRATLKEFENGAVVGGEGSGGGVVNPTCLEWVEGGKVVVGYQNSGVRVWDVERGVGVLGMESGQSYDGTIATQINKIVLHPTLSLLISAHEDRYIRLFDINSGKCIHSMLGHLNAVTSLAISPSHLTFASSGHDCSLR